MSASFELSVRMLNAKIWCCSMGALVVFPAAIINTSHYVYDIASFARCVSLCRETNSYRAHSNENAFARPKCESFIAHGLRSFADGLYSLQNSSCTWTGIDCAHLLSGTIVNFQLVDWQGGLDATLVPSGVTTVWTTVARKGGRGMGYTVLVKVGPNMFTELWYAVYGRPRPILEKCASMARTPL